MPSEPDLVRMLLDIEEIKGLKARYFRTLDEQDWEAFAEVFTDDAVLDVPEVEALEVGREAIVGAIRAALTGAQTVHHGHMPEIELTGTDTATGTWAMEDYVEWEPSPSGARVGLRGFGHYRDEYARVSGRWRIARTRLERLRVDSLDPAGDPRRRRAAGAPGAAEPAGS